jgi:hypothetical protein
MSENKPEKKIKIIYVILGVTALIIAAFDLLVNNYFDVALSISWGVLFIYLGIKSLLDSKLSAKSVKIIHSILLVMIILTSFFKLFYRLKNLTP